MTKPMQARYAATSRMIFHGSMSGKIVLNRKAAPPRIRVTPENLRKFLRSSSVFQAVPLRSRRSWMPRQMNSKEVTTRSHSQSERCRFMAHSFPGGSVCAVLPSLVGNQIEKISHDGDAEDDAVDQRCNRCEG